jgi:hypothetical protein
LGAGSQYAATDVITGRKIGMLSRERTIIEVHTAMVNRDMPACTPNTTRVLSIPGMVAILCYYSITNFYTAFQPYKMPGK